MTDTGTQNRSEKGPVEIKDGGRTQHRSEKGPVVIKAGGTRSGSEKVVLVEVQGLETLMREEGVDEN